MIRGNFRRTYWGRQRHVIKSLYNTPYYENGVYTRESSLYHSVYEDEFCFSVQREFPVRYRKDPPHRKSICVWCKQFETFARERISVLLLQHTEVVASVTRRMLVKAGDELQKSFNYLYIVTPIKYKSLTSVYSLYIFT
jgi:hypothetical protein